MTMFDLASLVDRFKHVPTELHSAEEKHRDVEQVLRATAAELVDIIPQAQEAHQVVDALEAAGRLVHDAIDREAAKATTGVIRTNDQVVGADSGGATSEVSGEATSQAGAAPEAATPPAPPAAPATAGVASTASPADSQHPPAVIADPPVATSEAASSEAPSSPSTDTSDPSASSASPAVAPSSTSEAPDVPAVSLPAPVEDIATATDEAKPAHPPA